MIKPDTFVFVYDPIRTPEFLEPLIDQVLKFPGSSEAFTRSTIARLIAGDPRLLVVIGIHRGKLVGHTITELVGQVAVLHQCRVDKGFPRSIDIFLRLADTWAMQNGAKSYLMEVSQHDAGIWTGKYKRYGFKVKSYNVERLVKNA